MASCAAVLAAAALAGCVTQRDNHLAKDNARQDAAADNVQLGMAYISEGNLQRAKDKLDRALKEDPSNANAHSVYGLYDERIGEQKKADEEFHTAMRMAPDDPVQLNIYAGYLCRQGRVDEGVTRFVQLVKNPLYRTPEVAYTNMGVCLHGAHRDDEAATAFRRALAVKPDHAEAEFQIGELDLLHGRALEARQRLEQFLVSYTPTADLLLLGLQASQKLEDAAGIDKYGKLLRADFPSSPQARSLGAAGAAAAADGPH